VDGCPPRREGEGKGVSQRKDIMRRLGIFALPTSKRKLTIDQAEAALKRLGYTLDFRSGQTNPPAFATSYEVKQPNGVSKRMTVDQIKALAYEKS